MNRVRIERVVRAPREVVFARYTDHTGWTDWAHVGKVSVIQRGRTEPGGEGCVRRFALIGLDEQVTELRAPEVMAYRIVHGGFPLVDHHARVTFEPCPEGTRVVWHTEFDTRVPLVGGTVAYVLRAGFSRIMERFARHVERRA
jgi:hypothetical protein